MRTGKDWLKRDPEFAAQMGRKGGKVMRPQRSQDYWAGYKACWIATKRARRQAQRAGEQHT